MEILIVNIDHIPGKKITKVLGVVYGATEYGDPKSIISDISDQAKKLGANAVIGFTLNGDIAGDERRIESLFLGCGTAVIVEDL